MSATDAGRRVETLFLDDEGHYGCAETVLVALNEQYGLPDPEDSSPALVLNGGFAYSGGTCGALTGAALAVGRLAAERIPDHREAKSSARFLIQQVMAEFDQEYGATDCLTLTGYDMVADHEAFMEDGTWKTTCTAQLRFVVDRLAALHDEDAWTAALSAKPT